MAYELYFRARQHAGMDEARFLYYFHHRPHYRVQDGQAWYINEATGVDFCFTLTPLPDAQAPTATTILWCCISVICVPII